MKHRMIYLLAIMITVLSCTGCGQQVQEDNSDSYTSPSVQTEAVTSDGQTQNSNADTAPPTQTENTDAKKKDDVSATVDTDENPSDSDELFEISNLSGTVTEFFDDGCTLSPTIESGDNLSYQAAPGYEDTFVSVSYNSDCVFWIAYVDFKTSLVTYEPATIKDVKKQTSLILCGEYDENEILHADRIFIYRTDRM